MYYVYIYIYIGLIDDVPRTDAAFRSYIASPYLEKALDPLIKQYSQVTTSKAVLSGEIILSMLMMIMI